MAIARLGGYAYDQAASYSPAIIIGVLFNLLTLLLFGACCCAAPAAR